MEFVIDRSKWRCGGDKTNKVGRGKTALLNSSGFMCCLGQTCNQIGIKKKDLIRLGEPNEIDVTEYKKLPEIFFYKEVEDEGDELWENTYLYDTELSTSAIEINDDEEITQEEREEKLINLFKKHNHIIKFIGKEIRK